MDVHNELSVLFIEGKSDAGMNIKRDSQDEFKNKYSCFKVIRTNSVEEVKEYIEVNSFDKMKIWSKEVDLFMDKGKVISEEDCE